MTEKKKENFKNAVKLTAQVGASIGTGIIVGAYVASAPFRKNYGKLASACIWIGGVFLEDMISEKVSVHTGDKVDLVFAMLKNAKEVINGAEKFAEGVIENAREDNGESNTIDISEKDD